MPATANSLNYYVGKGIVAFQKDGDSSFRDLGNVSAFEFAPNVTILDHYSSRTGVKTKDRSIVTEKSATVNITVEEWTLENMQLALMGGNVSEVSSVENGWFYIFENNQIDGVLKFTGTNDVGPRYEMILNKVSFIPGNSINPISEEWGTLELTANVLVDSNGYFGTMKELSPGTTTEIISP